MMTDQGDHTATTNAGTVATSMVSVASAQNQPSMSSLPRRIPMPNLLKFEDNLLLLIGRNLKGLGMIMSWL